MTLRSSLFKAAAGLIITAGLSPVLLSACTPEQDQKQVKTEQTGAQEGAASAYRPVTSDRLVNAAAEPGNWMNTGRTYDEQHYSPLTQVTKENIADLGLAWSFDLYTMRGIEATPIVVDGAMYTTGSWSTVYAFDAKTGELLWDYDPEVPRTTAAKACCDAVNRGPAVWGDNVYVGVFDGRLIALDRKTGALKWEVWTVDPDLSFTISGAPRIMNGKVIIGNGGADMTGTRGYVTAYDAETGEQVWRFYTVPGNPADGFENPILEMAAETWHGEWWKQGGGGTAYDAFAYDPDLNLLYIGVGNGSPWNRRIRSEGKGDNLFLSSIVAVNADTGEYVWHYQTTPGEQWDYTATQHMILADIDIDGKTRKVLMQAPKNGFFYVIDRVTGEFISGDAYAEVNWATGIDPQTGRPIETDIARYEDMVNLIMPGPGGAHNWHPMAYSPRTGYVYIPTLVSGFMYEDAKGLAAMPARVNMGVDMKAFTPPEDIPQEDIDSGPPGRLVAWDPIARKEVWHKEHTSTWNGGVLATASDLLFQGASDGSFSARDAITGEKLWTFDAQTGVMAAPISYMIDGEQYVAVMVGWGGVMGVHATPYLKGVAKQNLSRVLVFKLGATGVLPPLPPEPDLPELTPPAETAAKEEVDTGRILFNRHCQHCHGAGAIAGGLIPDLRYASAYTHEHWADIVIGGEREAGGMPSFAPYLTEEQADLIHAYIIHRANQRKAELEAQAD